MLVSPSKSQNRLKSDCFRDSTQKEDRVSLPSINSVTKLKGVEIISVNNFDETIISSPKLNKTQTRIGSKKKIKMEQTKRNSVIGKTTKAGMLKPV